LKYYAKIDPQDVCSTKYNVNNSQNTTKFSAAAGIQI